MYYCRITCSQTYVKSDREPTSDDQNTIKYMLDNSVHKKAKKRKLKDLELQDQLLGEGLNENCSSNVIDTNKYIAVDGVQPQKKHKKHKKKTRAENETETNPTNSQYLSAVNLETNTNIVTESINSDVVHDHISSCYDDEKNISVPEKIKKKRRRRKHIKRSRQKSLIITDFSNENDFSMTSNDLEKTKDCYKLQKKMLTSVGNLNDSIMNSNDAYCKNSSTTVASINANENHLQDQLSQPILISANSHLSAEKRKTHCNRKRKKKLIIPTLTYIQYANSNNEVNNEKQVVITEDATQQVNSSLQNFNEIVDVTEKRDRNRFEMKNQCRRINKLNHIQFESDSDNDEEVIGTKNCATLSQNVSNSCI